MKFSLLQNDLEKGKCIARQSWSDFPHKAFYAKQINTLIIVDCNNKVMQSGMLECQIMANDWYTIEDTAVEKGFFDE